jgi:cellulose synthase/poly-beta-1,6-N-acetylglucosamine synthase-like glycosyltransferase
LEKSDFSRKWEKYDFSRSQEAKKSDFLEKSDFSMGKNNYGIPIDNVGHTGIRHCPSQFTMDARIIVVNLRGVLAPRHIAVVVPAHNEQACISRCVTNLLSCDKPSGKFSVYVVADNCTDDTAARAEAAGAQVLVRHDEQRRGKGYALDYAFNILLKQDIDAVLVIDADTVVEANFIRACEQVFANGADAVQCRYTVNNPQASLRTRLMHLAFLAFNVLRPRGRERWGLSVGISGNGFGLTRKTLQSVPYCARSVVEDLEYHLALVRAGMRVCFVDATTVRADMPTGGAGTDSQRARWEGGRFRMMREHIPPLTKTVFRGRLRLLEPLLELLLLPLGWHVLLLLITLLIPFALTQGYALFGFGVVLLHVLAALWVGGGTIKDLAKTRLGYAPSANHFPRSPNFSLAGVVWQSSKL